jgi:hypothetical protein
MPKLLTKSKNSKTSRKRTLPHSPFQMMLVDFMASHDLSNESMAALMSKNGAKVNKSTIWIWTHSTNGYPNPRYFGEKHIKALAGVMMKKETEIREALDQSRGIYTGVYTPGPAPHHDSLQTLLELFQGKSTTWVRRQTVVNAIKAFMKTSTASKPQTQPE